MRNVRAGDGPRGANVRDLQHLDRRVLVSLLQVPTHGTSGGVRRAGR